jgi:glycerophosphoryl diester phosphodiesterase
MSRAPDWLTARPVAHRGLHDRERGIIENMPGAVSAAIAGNFAIEVDLQPSADGEAMVHHDDVLDRLTQGSGALRQHSAAALQQVAFKDTTERMMTLGGLCELVGGRVPLVIEVKSQFNGDEAIIERIAIVLQDYTGPVALMSFDPDKVSAIRQRLPHLSRGIVAERSYDGAYWAKLTPQQRHSMTALRHAPRTRPDFVAYNVNDLPAPAPWIARNLFGLPLLTWTVRTGEQRTRATAHADQMIFEGFVPQP